MIEAYVEIEYVSRRVPAGAIVMGKNDLWIAAVTKVTGATLLTCDTDFDHLHPGQITRNYSTRTPHCPQHRRQHPGFFAMSDHSQPDEATD